MAMTYRKGGQALATLKYVIVGSAIGSVDLAQRNLADVAAVPHLYNENPISGNTGWSWISSLRQFHSLQLVAPR